MALLEIKFVPDEVLRRKAHKVTQFRRLFPDPLVDNMIETLTGCSWCRPGCSANR